MTRAPAVLSELCAGTFVVSRYVARAPTALAPWQGSKVRVAKLLAHAARLRRGASLSGLVLADAGTWGWVTPHLLDPDQRARVVDYLHTWRARCPRCAAAPGATPACELCGPSSGRTYSHALWSWIATRPPRAELAMRSRGSWWRPGATWSPELAAGLAELVAAYLVVQAGNARGRPVELCDTTGAWRTAGYGHLSNSARAKGFVDRVHLERVAERVARVGEARWPDALAVYHGSATEAADLAVAAGAEAVHLLDWPYQLHGDRQTTRTGYQAALPLDEGCALAARLADAGGHVLVCEGGPMGRRLGPGWYDYDVSAAFSGTLTGREWLCSNRPLSLGLAPRQATFAFGART